MITITVVWALLIFFAFKLSEREGTRELGRSIMAGLVGLSVAYRRRRPAPTDDAAPPTRRIR